MIMNSGARTEKNIRKSLLFKRVHFPSFTSGTFGWTETHVHANVVARQLHRMSHIVLPGGLSDGSSEAKVGTPEESVGAGVDSGTA